LAALHVFPPKARQHQADFITRNSLTYYLPELFKPGDHGLLGGAEAHNLYLGVD